MTKALIRAVIPASCLAGVVFVGLASVSGAKGDSAVPADTTTCSEETVAGTYAFAIEGNVAGLGPIAASGTTTFDGKGEATITGFIARTKGSSPAFETSADGTYTVDADSCTGSGTFTIPAPGLFNRFTSLQFEGVIVNQGEEIRYLITNPGVAFAGTSVRQEPPSKM